MILALFSYNHQLRLVIAATIIPANGISIATTASALIRGVGQRL